jgi:hypothetical protein
VQLSSEFLFMTRDCLKMNVKDDRSFSHYSRNELRSQLSVH